MKNEDFQDFKEVVSMIKAKEHLTLEGLELIKTIKVRMNRGRL